MNISTIILTTIVFACVIGAAWSLYILHRNNKVYEFRIKIISMADEASRRRLDEGGNDFLAPCRLLDKHTYDSMLYSFRPLKLDEWFTEEEIKELGGK